MKREDWDARYADLGPVTALQPNRFVAMETAHLAPGRVLDLACGEGRNAVWLAEQGWQVTGIDFSEVAIERARRLADARRVSTEFVVGDVFAIPLEHARYDLVLIAYLQVGPDQRSALLEMAVDALAPGGTLLLVAHDLRNLTEGYGGPSSASVLWTVEEATDVLRARGLVVERGEEVRREVEGAPGPAIDTLVRAHLDTSSPDS
jgi:2-polyprenyl-3-methyl-5-hydroxy-6-metoxy-1,4-benzoquinol methylase